MTGAADRRIAQWVALSLIPSVGSRTLAGLLDHFGSLDAILSATEDDLRAVPRIGPRLAAAIRAIDLNRTRAEIAAWQADGIAILLRPGWEDDASLPGPLSENDPAWPVGAGLRPAEGGFAEPSLQEPAGIPSLYPTALQALGDAPPVLFARGSLRPDDARAVALVGTRRPAAAARRFAEAMAGAMAARGWTIVSGLAAGIDSAAHWGALRAGGRTLAVLGCGARAVYPPQNAGLAAQVIQQGALLSEVRPDAPPSSPALVARNRLISGLSRAVIVVEAGGTSGSLRTARFAHAQGRRVYAVEYAEAGNRQLIADGARPLAPDFVEWDRLSGALERQE